jgi:sugar phosphate permease
MLIDDLARRGVPHDEALIRIGGITSLGVLAYALGKLFLGGLGDFWGGRISFLIGLGGATAFTLLFTTTSFIPVFSIAWFGNRLTQSVAWAGLLKVSGKWFDFSSYGTIIGILSVSYLVGDAVARQSMGLLIQHGVGWRTLFYLVAAIAAAWLLLNGMFLRESRVDVGFSEAVPNPLNLYADAPAERNLVAFLLPLFKSRAFLLVCLLSLGCTIVRETFNSWTPVYLHDHLGYGMSKAARMSAVFPAVGAAAVILSGWLSDRLGTNGRALILLVGLCATAVALGLIDGIGYLGAVVAGDSVARASVAFGWQGVFVALSVVSAIAALGAAGLLVSTARGSSPAKGLAE